MARNEGKADPKTPAKDALYKSKNPDGRRTRKRACMPKVRTGCVTCKARRVKCDEGKPECSRCLNFGTVCEGYRPVQPNQMRVLLPRNFNEDSSLLRSSSSSPFQSEAEEGYFKTFQTQTTAALSGFFVSALWDRVIIHAAQTEAFVCDLVVAIGAVTASKNAKYMGQRAEASQHNKFAFDQYERGIRAMRTSVMGEDESPRKALIGCLLVTCFEGLLGQRLTATQHALSGHKLLRNWLQKSGGSSSYRPGISSPAPEIVDDDLIQAFGRLDLQVATFFDPRSAETHGSLKNEGTDTISRMPEAFRTVDEARVYLELIQRRGAHWMWAAAPESAKAVLHSGIPSPMSSEGWDSMPASPLILDPGLSRRSPPAKILEPEVEQEKYLREMQRWRVSFQPLFQSISPASSPQALIVAKILLVQFHSGGIALASALDLINMSAERQTSGFRTTVGMSEAIIRETEGVRQNCDFTFDLGIIPSLHMAAKWCDDRNVRQHAIALLRMYAFREGVWDSNMMADSDEQLLHLEQQGIDPALIPGDTGFQMGNLVPNTGAGKERRTSMLEPPHRYGSPGSAMIGRSASR